MRLLLDEQISPEIAEALRRRGHDVVAVAERQDLRSLADADILAAATAEGRAVASVNVRDFASLGERRLPSREWHAGVVLISRRAAPGSRDAFGILIRALDAFLGARTGAEELVGRVIWLEASHEDA